MITELVNINNKHKIGVVLRAHGEREVNEGRLSSSCMLTSQTIISKRLKIEAGGVRMPI